MSPMSQSIDLYNQLAKNFSRKINFDLKRIKHALSKLGHPENQLRNVINIIGSDGKYSLLTSLKYFLQANNYSVSTYISPSIKDIRERFFLGDKHLSYNDIKKSMRIIKNTDTKLTVFEALTLIFIINAAKRNSDFNLVEAGALFAKDSTNVFSFPRAQAIVNINKQHLNFLKKKTLDEIINQKIGYLSKFTNIYIGKQKIKVLRKIKKILNKNPSKCAYSTWKLKKIKNDYFYIDKFNKIKIRSNNIQSKGLLENLCQAIQIALNLNVNKNLIQKTIPKIKFEARVQILKEGKIKKKLYRNERILVDGCHSVVGAKNLYDFIKKFNIPIFGIWSMTKNKDPDEFIKQFNGVFEKIFITTIKNEPASLPADILIKSAIKNNLNYEKVKNFEEALNKVSSKKRKLIVCFGSLYGAGEILKKN